MKILAIGCSHGKLPQGLKEFIKTHKIQMVFSLGDHCNADETRMIEFSKEFDEKYKANGHKFYPTMRQILDKKYEDVFSRFAKSGRETVLQLDELGVPVLIVPGNNEFTDTDKKLSGLNLPSLRDACEETKHCEYFERSHQEIGKLEIVSLGLFRGNAVKKKVHPEHKKINMEFEKALNEIFARTKGNNVILLGHDQPFDTEFDTVNYPASPMHGKHVGDEILRDYILQEKPVMFIGAHMHEWQGETKLGSTRVIATGYGREGKFAVLDTETMKVEFIKI